MACETYFDRFRRQTYVTPKTDLFLLKCYDQLYADRRQELRTMQSQLSVGLDKMQEAAESAEEMGKILAVQAKGVEKAKSKAQAVMAVVQVALHEADKVKVVVEKSKGEAETLVAKIAVKKAKADVKLADAKPMLDAAEKALLTIQKADIQLVSKLAKPPHLIMRIMDVVLILFQNSLDKLTLDEAGRKCPTPSWQYALKLMANNAFLQNLLEFPRDKITEEVVELMIPYLRMEDYTFESAKKVCGNVAGLCSWTIAMKDFYFVNRVVLPLVNSQKRMEAKHDKAMTELKEANEMLEAKNAEVNEKQQELAVVQKHVKGLEDEMNGFLTKQRIATTLVSSLGGEKVRWTNNIKEYEEEIFRLVGDALIYAGFITYVGPFNQEYRKDLQNRWLMEVTKKEIPISRDMNCVTYFADAPLISEWNLQGLPNDELSVQNGILATRALRAPLMIDPQTQGKTWIKNMENKNNLMCTQLSHKHFRTHLEDAVSLGRPMLLEDILVDLDPCLDNILEKNYYRQGGRALKVKVGDKELDVEDGFKFYVSTKLPNPVYSPEICARTSVIDFAVTTQGLEDQLLGKVIQSEKQELEEMKNEMQESMVEGNRKIKEMEQYLLHKLVTIEGSLVDDPEIEEVLNTTQATVKEVSEMLITAKEAEVKINVAREEYRPVAIRGSLLYFLIVELSDVNCMYQTSLAQFLEIFQIAMERAAPNKVTSKRMDNIIQYLTYDTFRYISRGFYEKHKFLYALVLSFKVDLNRKIISQAEINYILKGGAALDLSSCAPKPAKWITDDMWLNIVALSQLPHFTDLQRQAGAMLKQWKTWFEKDAPEEENIPFTGKLDPFKKLMMMRAWCMDRMIAQSKKYIETSMGPKFAEPPLLDKELLFEESW